MRVYTSEILKGCSKLNLEHKLDMVKTSIDLTKEEMRLNIDALELALNGGVHFLMSDVIKGIEESSSDTYDMMQGS